MTKQEFFEAMDAGNLKFPETDEELAWWDEWYDAHPELKAEDEMKFLKMNDGLASEYMCLKIFARSFIEENGTGIYFATVEPRRITICKRTGKLAQTHPKLIIEL
jgi:hypothetical protein